MIKRYQGRTKLMWFPVTVSTVFLVDSLVAWSSGQLIAATNTTAGSVIPGVIRHAIAATDDDYATERNVEVEVPVEKNVVWKCTVDANGALLLTDIGTYMDIGTDDTGDDVDTTGSTYDIFLCVGFISTVLGYFVLNIGADASTK